MVIQTLKEVLKDIELRPENKAYPLMRYGFGEVLLRLEIARYPAPSRLALDAHCSPKKTQFATFRDIDKDNAMLESLPTNTRPRKKNNIKRL